VWLAAAKIARLSDTLVLEHGAHPSGRVVLERG
jgi:hypothetical protein